MKREKKMKRDLTKYGFSPKKEYDNAGSLNAAVLSLYGGYVTSMM